MFYLIIDFKVVPSHCGFLNSAISWWIFTKWSLPSNSMTLKTYIYHFGSSKKGQRRLKEQTLMELSQIGRIPSNSTTSKDCELHPPILDGFSSNKVHRCLLWSWKNVSTILNHWKRPRNDSKMRSAWVSACSSIIQPSVDGIWSNKVYRPLKKH